MELKHNERMAAIREEAVATLNLGDAVQVGTAEYIMETANGFARVTVTAIKDFDFDVLGAREEYEAVLAARAEREEARAAAKAEKEAAKAAKAAAKAE